MSTYSPFVEDISKGFPIVDMVVSYKLSTRQWTEKSLVENKTMLWYSILHVHQYFDVDKHNWNVGEEEKGIRGNESVEISLIHWGVAGREHKNQ